MQIQTLRAAKEEALRFVKAADKAIDAFEEDWLGSTRTHQYIRQNKHNSGAKRASLDLTRVLSDMRLDR